MDKDKQKFTVKLSCDPKTYYKTDNGLIWISGDKAGFIQPGGIINLPDKIQFEYEDISKG